MRYYLLLLAFISVELFAQIPQTNLTFRWVGGFGIVGSDTCLIDSLTGLPNVRYKVTNVSIADTVTMTNGYISAKSNVFLNGQPICTIFADSNYLSQAFFEMKVQTINPDSTELFPYRLTSIAYYSVAQTLANKTWIYNYFKVPTYALTGVRTVGAGKTYATVEAAAAAASANDTIYVFSGTYTDASYTYANKVLYIIGIGNVVWKSTNASFLYRTDATSNYLSNVTLDGNSAKTYAIYGGAGVNTIEKCRIINATNGFEHGAGVTFVINKCMTNGTFTTVFGGNGYTINECFVNSSQTQIVNILGATSTTYNYTYNLFNPRTATSTTMFIWRTSGKFNFKFNRVEIGLTGAKVIYTTSGTPYTGTYNIKGNYFNCTVANNTTLIANETGNTFDCTITQNTFNFTNQGANGKAIILYDKVNPQITYNRFLSTSTTGYTYIELNQSLNTGVGLGNVSYNYFDVKNASNYCIRVGAETTGTGDDFYKKCLIEGNYLRASNYYQTATPATIHGIFIGFNDSVTTRYNWVDGAGLNIIYKGNGSMTGGYCYGNISINGINGLRLKGCTNVEFYNNTVYNDLPIASQLLMLDENTATTPASAIFKNNILFSKYNTTAKTLLHLEDNSTITSNYNIVYTTGADVIASLNASSKTWSEWKGLGYDANSYNVNPNFQDTASGLFYCKSPTVSLNNGFTLSSTYSNGLDIDTDFVNGSIVLRNFGLRFDIGSYAKADTRVFINNGKVYSLNGKILKIDY